MGARAGAKNATMTSRKQRVDILVGALADPLHEQIGVPPEVTAEFQQATDMAVHLRVGGYLTDSCYDTAIKRIHRALAKALNEGSNTGQTESA